MNTEHKKNIVFDLDGTLLDSRRRHISVLTDCVNEIHGTKYGDCDFDDFVKYKAEGYNGLSYLASKKIPNESEIFSLWKKKIEYWEYLQTDVLYPDIRECLDVLRKNRNLFLITARANNTNAERQLSSLGIDKFFIKISIVSNSGDTGYSKYEALNSLSADCVIGDTEADLDLAKHAKCMFFPLNNGFRSAKFWKQYVERSYGNIHEILSQLNILI
jgi:phosphoglycolate phosphatase-like HAD superfamily hydrolase